MDSPNLTATSGARQQQSSMATARHWFAIYTRSHFEKKVHHDLLQSRFEVFLPLIKEKKFWSDRIKTISVPLLPSYVFVKVDSRSISRLYDYPGIVRVISFEGKPCAIRDEEIQLLESIISHNIPVRQEAHCGIGDKVKIVRGLLKGWEGQVQTTRGQSRVMLQIASIKQCISVEINQDDLEKIN